MFTTEVGIGCLPNLLSGPPHAESDSCFGTLDERNSHLLVHFSEISPKRPTASVRVELELRPVWMLIRGKGVPSAPQRLFLPGIDWLTSWPDRCERSGLDRCVRESTRLHANEWPRPFAAQRGQCGADRHGHSEQWPWHPKSELFVRILNTYLGDWVACPRLGVGMALCRLTWPLRAVAMAPGTRQSGFVKSSIRTAEA